MNHTAAKPSKRRSAPTSARRTAEKSKCTLVIDTDLSIKLGVAAALRGLDRSELVNLLLAESLRHIVISVRGQSEVSARGDDQREETHAEAA